MGYRDGADAMPALRIGAKGFVQYIVCYVYSTLERGIGIGGRSGHGVLARHPYSFSNSNVDNSWG